MTVLKWTEQTADWPQDFWTAPSPDPAYPLPFLFLSSTTVLLIGIMPNLMGLAFDVARTHNSPVDCPALWSAVIPESSVIH